MDAGDAVMSSKIHGGKRAAVGFVELRVVVRRSVDSGLSGNITQGIPWKTVMTIKEKPIMWKNGVVDRIRSLGVNRSGTPAVRPSGMGTYLPWSRAPK